MAGGIISLFNIAVSDHSKIHYILMIISSIEHPDTPSGDHKNYKKA